MTDTRPESTHPARDVSNVAGGSLPAALAAGVTGDTVESRLDAFCEIAFSHLASTGVSWLGFYRLEPATGEDEATMTLVACRDRPACSPIGLHGVCGQSARSGRTRIVADVLDLGADYVACDPRDRSEIVVPLRVPAADGDPGPLFVLDLDSVEVGRFSDADDDLLRAALQASGFEPISAGPALHGPWTPA